MLMYINEGNVYDRKADRIRKATLAELLDIIKESQFYASLNNKFYERQLEMGRDKSAAQSLDAAAYFYSKVAECVQAIENGQYKEVNSYDL